MLLPLPEDAASKEYLTQELESAETKLQELCLQWQSARRQQPPKDLSDERLPKSVQLAQLKQTADSLALAQAMTEWVAQAPDDDNDLIAQAEWCHCLAQLLLEHSDRISLHILAVPSAETYLPLYNYVKSCLVTLLRQELYACQYPKKPGACASLIRSCQISPDTSAIGQACYWLVQLQQSHDQLVEVVKELDSSTSTSSTDDNNALALIARELLRPLVQRIAFHFLETSGDRVTTTRIDRLPEWLLSYVRETMILSTATNTTNDAPHDVIHLGLTCVLPTEAAIAVALCFWQEVVRLVHWVLTERQFFRHPEIAGPRSNPIHLYNAMEQFLLFDRTLRELAPVGDDLMGLMDTMVLADDELCQWWIDRERESVFQTLFDDDSMVNVPKPLANHVSPRAEIFCALIRSVQCKASVLTAPGLYLRHVAMPLCSQFVDALRDTSTDLRNLLCQPSANLVSNLHEWIEIINGTHLAAYVLLKQGAWQDGMPATSQSDQDLARFGRSLERLVDVMVEELAMTFVETILMERAKFASYLMMASHLLASQELAHDMDVSAELKETRNVLMVLHQVCNSILVVAESNDSPTESSSSPSDRQIAQFAPRAIQSHIMTLVADKFLEVALDIHDQTPQVWLQGSTSFARDVKAIVGAFSELPLVQRLLNVSELLTTDASSTQGLFAALGGLVGASDFLDIHDFSSDGTIYDEAVHMLQAKGLGHLELKDAVSILNRKRY